MPVKKGEKVYPEWVQKFRKPGTTVKQKGDSYYLYKRTSRRIKGKKYPQPVDKYIGIITPDGVIESDRRRVSLSSLVVKEYGFSRTLLELCPESWKTSLGDEWEDILVILVTKWSPNSYLEKDHVIRSEDEFHHQFHAQRDALLKKIRDEHHVTLADLHSLDTIYIVYFEKERAVSVISEEQQQLLDKLGVNLEVC